MKISDASYTFGLTKSAIFVALVSGFVIHNNIAGAGEPQPGGAADTAAPVSAPPASRHARQTHEGAAGMIIYVDPQTGEIAEPPAAALEDLTVEDQELLSKAFNTSDEGLVEVPSPAPNGGVMIHLQGRFLSPLSISRHPDGQLTIQHRQEPLVADHPEDK